MRTLVLTRSDVERVATMELVVAAVERAFAGFGRGEATMPPKVYLPIKDHDGDFRAMPARLGDSAGVKWVSVHARNRKRHGLPTVMAVYVLNDPANAFPLAVMDGTLLTALRTGAAGAVASKYLARSVPETISFIGCGAQAYTLHDTHRVVFDGFESLAHDRNATTAQRFADRVGARVVSLEEAVAVYIDDIHQATESGEINVPLAAGDFTVEDIAGTLGEVVAGMRPKPDIGTTTLFDSTGLAVQDLSLARAIYEAARSVSIGQEIDLIGFDSGTMA